MASLKYNNVYINDYLTLVGPLESDAKLKKIDLKMDDYYYGEKTFEQAEIKMQKNVLNYLLEKNKIIKSEIDLIIGGDLINQISSTYYACINNSISVLGLYSACSTFTESLIVAANILQDKNIKKVVAVTSSHNKASERQFRYPIEYGAPRKMTQTYTATAAISTLISNSVGKIKIESATIGKVIEMGITDVNNMGAIMAPAAASTLNNHLKDLKRDISYYDLIITGDLGCIGKEIFKKYTLQNYNININNYIDAGCELYLDSQNVNAGGSGPTCLPLILFNKVLLNKKVKKILIMGTGALHNTTLVNQKIPVPAIAHAVSLEVL